MFAKSKTFWGITLAFGLLLPFTANAETIVGTCYEPDGKRFEYDNDKFQETEDGYSNSNPTFHFDSEEPDVLVERWESSMPSAGITREEVDKLAPPTVTESSIIFKTPDVIHAISQGEREAYTTTLYLDRGIGIFTRVRLVSDKPGEYPLTEPLVLPMGAIYKAKCNFNHAK